ncbi:MAG: response regulator [Candidatus Neomarinimicrobiota bacterium]
MAPGNAPIFLVEDDPAHAELIMAGFKFLGIKEEIRHFADGRTVLAQLNRCLEKTDGDGGFCLPGLILLDLRLPIMDGLEILGKIKTSKRLNSITVAILSTSEAEEDKTEAKTFGADDYYTKPWSFDDLCLVLKEIHTRWIG